MTRSARTLLLLAVAAAAGRALGAPTANGRIVYSVNTTTPQNRVYTAGSPGTFAAQAATVAGAIPTFIVDRAAPTRTEHIAGYVTTGGQLYVIRWNGTTWSAEWNVAVGGDGVNGRRFDIAYENVTGEAIVAYSTNANGSMAYRVWNGSTWTTATTLTAARLANIPAWIKLLPRPGSDEIALTASDTGSTTANTADLTTLIWSGTAWGNEPAAAHSTSIYNTTGQLVQNDLFDMAYASTSGNLMVVFTQATTAGQYYRYFSGSPTRAWGTSTSFGGTARTPPLQMVAASDPNSNNIVAGWNRGTATFNTYATVWTGAAWSTVTAMGTPAPPTVAINKKFITAKWLVVGGTSYPVVMWATATAGTVGFNRATVSGTTVAWGTAASQAFTGTFGAWAWMDSIVDPRSADTLMLTFSDANSDLWARQLILTAGPTLTWTADSSAALTATLTNATTQNFSFAYDRVVSAPPGTPGTPTYSNIATTSVTVSWTAATGATSYNLQRATDSAFTLNLTTVNGVTSPYSDVGPLTANTTYWYRVIAVNSGGSTTGTGSSVLTLPGAPGAPTYGSIAQTTLTVSWTAPTGGAASYNLQRATDSGFTLNLVTVNGVTSPYSASGLTANTTYWYRAIAVNASGSTTGTGSSVTTLPNAPGAPGTPTYTNIASTSVTVNWTAATGATSYNLQRATDSAFTLNLTTVNGVTSPYSDVGPLTANTTYWYRVIAVNSGGSTTGTGSSVLTLPGAPGAPTYGSIAQTTLTVSWTAPAGGATSYNLQRATDSLFTLNLVTVNGVTSPYSASGLTANTTYWYRAVAVNASGSTTGTGSSVTTLDNPPGAPGTPTYSSIAQTTLTVSWTAATGATSYNLQRATDSAFTLNLVTLNGVTSPYGDSGLTASTTYWYRVVAVNSGGSTTGTASSVTTLAPELRAIPGVPTAAANSCTQVTVSAPYTGDANGNSSTSFSRGPSATGPWTAVTGCGSVVGVSPRSCVDTAVSASTTYYYQVTFADADGVVGTNPQVTSAVTTPACTALNTTAGTATALASGCNQITVSAPFTGDGNGNGNVGVEYNTTNTWPGTPACTAVGASPRTCLVTNLAASTAYYVRVTYVDADGVLGVNPQVVGPLTTPACAGNGAAPMILFLSPSRNATVGGAETFKVQVHAPNGIAPANILYSLDGGATAAATANANYSCGTSCAVYQFAVATTGLSNGTHYATVRATDNSAFVAQLSQPFLVNNSGAVAAGSGHVLRRTSGSQLCLDCHAISTHSSQATSFNYGNWALECAACHTPHATTNIYLVKPTIETPNSGSKSVSFQNTAGVAANSFGTPQASGVGVNVCEVCHTKTKNSDATPRARNNVATDWTKHYTGSCTGCHPHGKGFAAGESDGGATCSGCHKTIWDGMTGAVAKTTKHTLGNVLGTNDAFGDTAVTWGSPLSANAAAARSCVNMCHNDHPHTLTSPLVASHENNVYMDATSQASRAATVRTSADKDKTDFESGQANGGMCVSCHRNPVESGTTPAHPAVDKAAYTASAHNYTAWAAYGTWQYTQHDGSVFLRNCTKCHADRSDGGPADSTRPFGAVHSSDYPALLAGSTNPNGAPATFVCYNCHGNGTNGTNLSSKDVATAVGRTRNHPANADNVHNSVTEANTAVFGNTLGVSGRHSNCLDCHEPHAARQGGRQYSVGTATFTSASTAVTGVGTNWTTFYAGARIKPWDTSTTWYTISTVNSATSITLTANAAATATNVNYIIVKALDNLAGPGTAGALGAQLTANPTFWTDTSSASFTKKTLAYGTDLEATLCIKCHSRYYWGTATDPGRGVPPAAPSGGTYVTGTAAFTSGSTTVTGTGTAWSAASHVGWVIKNNANGTWHLVTAVASATSLTISPAAGFTAAASAYTLQMAESDVAKEFNPSNVGNFAGTWANGETAGGFHPVLAAAGSNLGAIRLANLVTTNLPWSTTVRNTMTCTDCHESDTKTDPGGPHGSAASFILRGPNTTWNASVTLGSTIPAGTFCLNCHANSFTNSRFPDHSRNNHFVSCWNCHAAVPHGGPRPGLLVSGAGAGANVGGVIAGWDQTAPYWQGGATNRLYLISYPANNTSNWAQGNCGCNGTGH